MEYTKKSFELEVGKSKMIIRVEENLYAMDFRELFSLAIRNNPKRRFLFVSKVLGKHLAVKPQDSFTIARLLAEKLAKEGFDLNVKMEEGKMEQQLLSIETSECLRFIGFCETATGIGNSIAMWFKNWTYLHTTRESIQNRKSTLDFEEAHSHAVEHKIYDYRGLLDNQDTVVIIDDEITTANSCLNLIQAIQRKKPRKTYVVVSILNWMDEKSKIKVKEYENALETQIIFISLLSGNMDFLYHPAEEELWIEENEEDSVETEINNIYLDYFKKSQEPISKGTSIKYLKHTGRFGLLHGEFLELLSSCRAAGEELRKKRKSDRTLFIGNGEFIFIPMLIGQYAGEGIGVQSTTRSPILPSQYENYPIRDKISFQSLDYNHTENYLYNTRGTYEEVFIFLERDVVDQLKIELSSKLRNNGVRYINYVILSDALTAV